MSGVKARQRIERNIARAAAQAVIGAGFKITVSNGEDFVLVDSSDVKEILSEMFTTDDDLLIATKDGRNAGWIKFVYGNDGWDVISDYTVNMEEVIKPALALAERYGQ